LKCFTEGTEKNTIFSEFQGLFSEINISDSKPTDFRLKTDQEQSSRWEYFCPNLSELNSKEQIWSDSPLSRTMFWSGAKLYSDRRSR